MRRVYSVLPMVSITVRNYNDQKLSANDAVFSGLRGALDDAVSFVYYLSTSNLAVTL